jgi:hypothetical protein
LATEVTCNLPHLAVQYADYAVWQRLSLEQGCFDGQLAYWRRRLAPPLPPLRLGRDAAPFGELTIKSAVQILTLSPRSLGALRASSRAAGVSLFITLAAALSLVLHRRTRQADIRIATLVANRARTELAPLIGLLVNTVILRTQVSGDLPRREVLRRVRHTVVEALDHQEVPFEHVLECLGQDEAFDRFGVTPVLFLMQNTGVEQLSLPGLATRGLWDGQATTYSLTTFDWIVMAEEHQDGLQISLRYKPSLFGETEISGVLGELGAELDAWTREVGGNT